MGKFNFFDPFILLGISAVVAMAFPAVRRRFKPKPNERAQTWKPRGVAFAVLAVMAMGFPGAVITVPLFVGLVILSYRAGTTGGAAVIAPQGMPQTTHTQLAALHELFLAGALSRREFDSEKRKLLDGTAPAAVAAGTPTGHTAMGWLWAGVVAFGVGAWHLILGFVSAIPEDEPNRPWRNGVYRDLATMHDDATHTDDGRPIIG